MTAARDWFQLAPCGLLATDSAGEIIEANRTLAEWLSISAEDMPGRRFSSLLDPASRLLYETRHTQILHLVGGVDEAALTLMRADGSTMPGLINMSRDPETGRVAMAVFNAAERVQYEQALLAARRAAETSERRVRVLQEMSGSFDVSATDEDVAQSFAAAAKDAFTAVETAVYLLQDDGEFALMGGSSPLTGKVAPIPSLRTTPDVTVVHVDDEDPVYTELTAAMRTHGLASLSVTPLTVDGKRLGNLACFYSRRTNFDDQYFELQQALGRQASQTLTRVRLQRQLAFLALHDQLTGAANRQLLQLKLDDAITEATAQKIPLAVLFLDIDDFKSINDAFGHAAGDTVLVELAARLNSGVRHGDLVGRMGGDEFVAICRDTDLSAAVLVAERILAFAQQPVVVADGIVSASVSVGVSVYRPGLDPRPTAAHMLTRADAAMYRSKRDGKNRLSLSEAG